MKLSYLLACARKDPLVFRDRVFKMRTACKYADIPCSEAPRLVSDWYSSRNMILGERLLIAIGGFCISGGGARTYRLLHDAESNIGTGLIRCSGLIRAGFFALYGRLPSPFYEQVLEQGKRNRSIIEDRRNAEYGREPLRLEEL